VEERVLVVEVFILVSEFSDYQLVRTTRLTAAVSHPLDLQELLADSTAHLGVRVAVLLMVVVLEVVVMPQRHSDKIYSAIINIFE
jgi:hypothetical protein